MKGAGITAGQGQGGTKIGAVVRAVTEAIDSGRAGQGQRLPSISEISHHMGCSRDTAAKAYAILKKRGLIEAVPAKGYYVRSASRRVFMLLDDFSAFKEQLYHAFRENLPGEWTVDLLFHHYNERVFEQLVRESAGRYAVYVVMNLSHASVHPVLATLDPSRLLLLDMGSAERPEISCILQDFGSAVERCLEQGLAQIKKYREVVVVYNPRQTPHPPETGKAVRRFCARYGFSFRMVPQVLPGELRSGQLYLVIREADLVAVVNACRSLSLEPGREVGVLAYNDTPMKEIAANGISAISVDFREMGRKAALFAREGLKIREILPTSLILRQSL